MRFFSALALLLLSTASLLAEPAKVVVFGDSITAGGALPAAEKSQLWVTAVEAASGGKWRMINEGRGGRPTDSLKDFDAMLIRQPKADVLIIALGMNDSRDITPACVPKAVVNVRAMVEKGRKAWGPALRVILAGPTNLRKDTLGPTKPIADQRAAKLHELNLGFQALATELHTEFLSLEGLVPDASLGKDGVHPNGAGNAPIAEAVRAALK